MQVVKAIQNYLESLHISHIFGVSGANIEELFFALSKSEKIKPILAKHEANAVNMAEGYFCKTGKIGTVLVTSGGGAFNTVSPLTEALSSGIPTLLIVGQTPSNTNGQGAFQDSSGLGTPINSNAIFSTVSVAVRTLENPADICQILDDLINTAFLKRGPAVLLIPSNLFRQEVLEYTHPNIPEIQTKPLEVEQLLEVGEAIFNAKKLVVIGGKDALYSGYREIFARFVRITGALVALTPDAKGLWDHLDPSFIGLVGVMGHESATEAIADADLIVTIATTMPMLSRMPTIKVLKNKTVISINRTPSFLQEADIENLTVIDVVGNPNQSLNYLYSYLEKLQLIRFGERLQSPNFLNVKQYSPVSNSNKMSVQDSIFCLNDELPENADIFADAGNVGAAVIHYFKARGRGIFNVALGMGGMGHSFGCAIGAAVVSDCRAFVLAGDGSFYMNGLEIHTAWQYDLPITFIILNNNSHGMCHTREEIFLGETSGTNLFRPSFIASGIQAMLPGIIAYEVTSLSELRTALKETTNKSGPAIISISVNPNEMPPFRNFIFANKPS